MQYVVKLLVGSESVDCMPLQAGCAGLGLNENGITWLEDAPVRIEIKLNELYVTVSDELAEFKIARNGRIRQLKAGQSVRMLCEDVLYFGEKKITVQAVYKQNASSALTQALKTAGRAAMLTLAATMTLSACSKIFETPSGKYIETRSYESCRVNSTDPEGIKACCLSNMDENEKTQCCNELTAHYPDVSCEQADPKLENVPEVPETTGGDIARSPYGECLDNVGDDVDKLKSCCEKSAERDFCCSGLEKAHPGVKCDFVIPEPVPEIPEMPMGEPPVSPYEECSHKADGDLAKLIPCCENMSSDSAREQCCRALENEYPDVSCKPLAPEIAPNVPPKVAGVPPVSPFVDCKLKADNDVKKIQSCCEKLENLDKRDSCCHDLADSFPGTVCAEIKSVIQEQIVGKMKADSLDDSGKK